MGANSNFKYLGKSGTSIVYDNLYKIIPKKLLEKFQIIIDHIDHFQILDENKIRIYYAHLDPIQNEEVSDIVGVNSKPLSNGGWKNFHKIVFVSYHQMESWIMRYEIPRSHCTVIKHGINPITIKNKPKDKIKIFHNSSPQRGLFILVDAFEKLCQEYSNLELNICSSYKIYHEDNNKFLKIFNDKQKEYEKSSLYNKLETHNNINNIGYVSNTKIRDILAISHIFAYPSIKTETFCLSLIEAMSAQCLCVHSNYGCLPETSANWTMMYDYHENIDLHQKIFYNTLKKSIEMVKQNDMQNHLKKQKEYIDYLFNWEKKGNEWLNLLNNLKDLPFKKVKKISSLIY